MKLTASTLGITGLTGSDATLHIVSHGRDINISTGKETPWQYVAIPTAATSHSSEFAIVQPPAVGFVRDIDDITIREAGNATETLAISVSDYASSTYTKSSEIFATTLTAYQGLAYTKKSGWTQFASDGSLWRQVAADA